MKFLAGAAFVHTINLRMAHPKSPDVRGIRNLLKSPGQAWPSLRFLSMLPKRAYSSLPEQRTTLRIHLSAFQNESHG